jgi:hypothetical protein
LQAAFWAAYVDRYLRGGDEVAIGDALFVFTAMTEQRLSLVLSPTALQTPVLFSERLSNRLLATSLGLRDGSQIIVINSWFKMDPELMTHTLVEEFVHAQQRLDEVDFAAQQQLPYAERPYEIEAKRIATMVLGYEPGDYETYLLREQPQELLVR